jgi:hypothetical protein
MKEIIDDYGRVILLTIVISGCLYMFCNIWFGSGSLFARISNSALRASTDSSTVTSTTDGQMYITKENGDTVLESQQGSASTLEDISNRRDPILHSVGEQNNSSGDSKTSQLLINTSYYSTDLFWAVDADGNEIHKSLTSTNSITTDTDNYNYYNDGTDDSGYFRVLSIATADGRNLISNLADTAGSDKSDPKTSIAYSNISYTNKTGAAGSGSYISGDTFNILDDDGGKPWLTYNVDAQQWMFYKSGTYCIRIFVCDSKGKSTTGTVYLSVNNRITKNDGNGDNTSEH